MAYPVDPIAMPRFVPGFVDTSDLNELANDLNSIRAVASFGLLNDDDSLVDVTLANVGQNYATDAHVVVVLPYDCTVRVDVTARFRMASGTSGQYSVQPGYNSGVTPTPGSATLLGRADFTTCQATGPTGASSAGEFGFVSLAAGTYVFYGVAHREANGSNTDANAAAHVSVSDAGGR